MTKSARIAYVALIVSVVIQAASYLPAPNSAGGSFLLLGLPGLLAFPLHISAMVMFPFAAISLVRGDVRAYDFWRRLSLREIAMALVATVYLAATFVYCFRAMEAPTLDPNVELQLKIRLFSGAWIFVLGAAWSVLRCARPSSASAELDSSAA